MQRGLSVPETLFLQTMTQLVTPMGQEIKSKHFANCETEGIIYFLLCAFNMYYVVKIRKMLKHNIFKHLYDDFRWFLNRIQSLMYQK